MKIGSIVTLKSGGPDMTVIAVTGDDVTTRWHKGEGQDFGNDTFHRDTLTDKDQPPAKTKQSK